MVGQIFQYTSSFNVFIRDSDAMFSLPSILFQMDKDSLFYVPHPKQKEVIQLDRSFITAAPWLPKLVTRKNDFQTPFQVPRRQWIKPDDNGASLSPISSDNTHFELLNNGTIFKGKIYFVLLLLLMFS